MPYTENSTLVIPIPPFSAANAGGHYRVTFPPVPVGGTFAFSYRIKADKEAIFPAVKRPSRKEYIGWSGSASCTGLQIAQVVNSDYNALVVPYTDCGAKTFSYWKGGELMMQGGDFANCKYRDVKVGNVSQCAHAIPDIWQHYYAQIDIGTYGQPNTKVQMWQKNGDDSWKQYIDRGDYTLSSGTGFASFMHTVYMTGKNPLLDHPPIKVLFDETIVAFQPFFAQLQP